MQEMLQFKNSSHPCSCYTHLNTNAHMVRFKDNNTPSVTNTLTLRSKKPNHASQPALCGRADTPHCHARTHAHWSRSCRMKNNVQILLGSHQLPWRPKFRVCVCVCPMLTRAAHSRRGVQQRRSWQLWIDSSSPASGFNVTAASHLTISGHLWPKHLAGAAENHIIEPKMLPSKFGVLYYCFLLSLAWFCVEWAWNGLTTKRQSIRDYFFFFTMWRSPVKAPVMVTCWSGRRNYP